MKEYLLGVIPSCQYALSVVKLKLVILKDSHGYYNIFLHTYADEPVFVRISSDIKYIKWLIANHNILMSLSETSAYWYNEGAEREEALNTTNNRYFDEFKKYLEEVQEKSIQ